MSKLVEMPVLYFRDRTYPSRSGPVESEPEPTGDARAAVPVSEA